MLINLAIICVSLASTFDHEPNPNALLTHINVFVYIVHLTIQLEKAFCHISEDCEKKPPLREKFIKKFFTKFMVRLVRTSS